jgi:hypothetical protein
MPLATLPLTAAMPAQARIGTSRRKKAFHHDSLLDGVVISVEGEVIWQLESGLFPYYQVTVAALHDDPKLRDADSTKHETSIF